jgi:molybdopterin-containing oxidoreductase family membrane subunit
LYTPTFYDIATFVGTIGLFFTLLFLFVRVLPAISIFEVRELLHRKFGSPKPLDKPVDPASNQGGQV